MLEILPPKSQPPPSDDLIPRKAVDGKEFFTLLNGGWLLRRIMRLYVGSVRKSAVVD